MSIQGIRDFFSTLRASFADDTTSPSQADAGPDAYEAPPGGRHRARNRWLERHHNSLEWVGDAGVLDTCAELGEATESAPVRRSRPAA